MHWEGDVAVIGRTVLKRAIAARTHRIASMPILALSVHSACNCRCVMCDIWKANADRRELGPAELEAHLAAIRRLGVRRVMLTGGEPLMHSNLWSLCGLLESARVEVTLVTTGLLLAQQAPHIVRWCDDVIVSLDGSREVHDRVRRIRGAYDRIAGGIRAIRAISPRFRMSARSVVQKLNYSDLSGIVDAAHALGLDHVSFLAADVSSPAFNRSVPWTAARRREVMLDEQDLPRFREAVERLIAERGDDFRSGFIVERPDKLRRLVQYYAALLGLGEFPSVRCRAPWISAVVDADGTVRPCFFHGPYGSARHVALDRVVNADAAVAFRRGLDVRRNETCRRCVCPLAG